MSIFTSECLCLDLLSCFDCECPGGKGWGGFYEGEINGRSGECAGAYLSKNFSLY